jgi:hypothetical protein
MGSRVKGGITVLAQIPQATVADPVVVA